VARLVGELAAMTVLRSVVVAVDPAPAVRVRTPPPKLVAVLSVMVLLVISKRPFILVMPPALLFARLPLMVLLIMLRGCAVVAW
jgi:hypothetical protein